MVGALLVIVLCGLLLPITLLVSAFLFDLLVLAWFTVVTARRDVWPRMTGWLTTHRSGLHMPHLDLRHR